MLSILHRYNTHLSWIRSLRVQPKLPITAQCWRCAWATQLMMSCTWPCSIPRLRRSFHLVLNHHHRSLFHSSHLTVNGRSSYCATDTVFHVLLWAKVIPVCRSVLPLCNLYAEICVAVVWGGTVWSFMRFTNIAGLLWSSQCVERCSASPRLHILIAKRFLLASEDSCDDQQTVQFHSRAGSVQRSGWGLSSQWRLVSLQLYSNVFLNFFLHIWC